MSVKITLIGAGSVVFAKSLLGDVLQFPELSDATICLMDIDAARLRTTETMTLRMIAKLGVNARVEATLDQRQAIRGARYVICTIQVGGYDPGTILDFEIPRKFGLRQTIADTLGVGGVFRGLRTIPVVNRIARDIAEVGAPGCMLLNYTNPMAMLCRAVDRAVGIPHVGLCHSVQSTSRRLAAYASLDYSDVSYLVAGINHMAFFLKFECRGRDAYPLLFRKLNDPAFESDRVRFEMMRRVGYFVTESSEHQAEYLPHFIPHGPEVVARFDIPLDDYLRRCASIIDTWKATEARLLGEESNIEVGPQTHEYGAFIIHSREAGVPRVIYGNVPNTGLIANLPHRCCVEVPCLVDAQGLQPTVVGSLPPQLAALCQSNINVQELTVEAALTGRREHIYHAVMSDPNTAATLTLDRIWAMCDELIAAHQKVGLLGEFAPVVPGTGRAFAGLGDRIIIDLGRDPRRKNGVVLSATNSGGTPLDLNLEVVLRDEAGAVRARRPVRLTLPAGRSRRVFTPLPLPPPASGFRVVIECAPDNVLAPDLVVPPRRLLRAGEVEPAFEIMLDGTPAVRSWILETGEKLRLRLRVDDSKVTRGSLPWSGSCVELFFAAESGGEHRQIILVPAAGKKRAEVVGPDTKPIAGTRIVQRRADAGYELDVDIPRAALSLPATGGILLDCYANLAALGGAHAGGRVSLSGSFNAHLGPVAYALLSL